MKKLLVLLIVSLSLFAGNVGPASAVEKNNVILDVPNMMPAPRYPATKITVPVIVTTFENNKPVILKSIELTAGGHRLEEKTTNKRLKSVDSIITKRQFMKMLKAPASRESQTQLGEVQAKIEYQPIKVDLKQAYPSLKPGDKISISVTGNLLVGDQAVTMQALYSATYQEALPDDTADGWYPGDGHLHTNYSNDNDLPLLGPVDVASSGKDQGLRWLIFTDHAQGLDFSTQGGKMRLDALGRI